MLSSLQARKDSLPAKMKQRRQNRCLLSLPIVAEARQEKSKEDNSKTVKGQMSKMICHLLWETMKWKTVQILNSTRVRDFSLFFYFACPLPFVMREREPYERERKGKNRARLEINKRVRDCESLLTMEKKSQVGRPPTVVVETLFVLLLTFACSVCLP